MRNTEPESFDEQMRRVWREMPLSINADEVDEPRVEDCNCNFCGNDYSEEKSNASSPGMYCSERCEIDEEEEN